MTVVGIVAALCAAPLAVVLTWTAVAYGRAARVRGVRRDDCPFENDDDVRPVVREVADVVRESAAVVRAMVAGLGATPPGWRAPAVRPGQGPVVLLLADAHVPVASMTSLGRRLARDLDASVHVEARGGGRGIAARAAGVVDQVLGLVRTAGGRPVLLVGHGAGGLVARRAARALRVPGLRLLTLATSHQERAEAEPRDVIADRAEVVNIYSLHDATILPAERAYLPGAFNVALRDEGHFGVLFHVRPYVIACESLADLAPHAAAS